MSDEELVKMARLAQRDDRMSTGALYGDLADRIEALTAENARLRDAVYIDDLTVTLQGEDRAAAIEGIGRALDLLRADMVDEAKASLRATLAKMKGEKG